MDDTRRIAELLLPLVTGLVMAFTALFTMPLAAIFVYYRVLGCARWLLRRQKFKRMIEQAWIDDVRRYGKFHAYVRRARWRRLMRRRILPQWIASGLIWVGAALIVTAYFLLMNLAPIANESVVIRSLIALALVLSAAGCTALALRVQLYRSFAKHTAKP